MRDAVLCVRTHDFEFQNAVPLFNSLPGRLADQPPPPCVAAQRAHDNTREVARFIQNVLLINGLDGKNGDYVSSINVLWNTPQGSQEWNNACWLPNRKQMLYGQCIVDGRLTSCADNIGIVAHEIFHGLTDYTTELGAHEIAGSLNESYSDLFGVLVANCNELDIGKWNWKLGQPFGERGQAIRNFQNPAEFGQADHIRDLDKRYSRAKYYNHGIHNKALYHILTIQDDDGNYVFTVNSAARLFYEALKLLGPISKFRDSRRAITSKAGTLFAHHPSKPQIMAGIQEAFDKVGISG